MPGATRGNDFNGQRWFESIQANENEMPMFEVCKAVFVLCLVVASHRTVKGLQEFYAREPEPQIVVHINNQQAIDWKVRQYVDSIRQENLNILIPDL